LSNLSDELKGLYASIKQRNENFSLREFATNLKLSPGELSEILRDKRKISFEKAKAIIPRLPISASRKNQLLNDLLSIKRNFLSQAKEINEDQFAYIANPIHYAFLALMRAPNFRTNFEWISSILNISVAEAYRVAYRLEKAGLITKDDNDELVRTHDSTTTSEDIPSKAIKESHKHDLENAIKNIDSANLMERDYSSLTILMDPAKIEEARIILRRAQDEIEALSSPETSKRVYKVATYLYPLSQDFSDNTMVLN
jgi:uncharacterized protein (TIGR02147 family)